MNSKDTKFANISNHDGVDYGSMLQRLRKSGMNKSNNGLVKVDGLVKVGKVGWIGYLKSKKIPIAIGTSILVIVVLLTSWWFYSRSKRFPKEKFIRKEKDDDDVSKIDLMLKPKPKPSKYSKYILHGVICVLILIGSGVLAWKGGLFHKLFGKKDEIISKE
jgi:hypothetical protein